MLISKAFAAIEDSTGELVDLANAPTATEALISNVGVFIVIGVMFYVLLIMPQQRRFKEHSSMLSDLKKGDRVITGGGLVGRIEKVIDDKEVLVDLGGGIKVTALRSTIQSKAELNTKDTKAKDDNKKDTKKA